MLRSSLGVRLWAVLFIVCWFMRLTGKSLICCSFISPPPPPLPSSSLFLFSVLSLLPAVMWFSTAACPRRHAMLLLAHPSLSNMNESLMNNKIEQKKNAIWIKLSKKTPYPTPPYWVYSLPGLLLTMCWCHNAFCGPVCASTTLFEQPCHLCNPEVSKQIRKVWFDSCSPAHTHADAHAETRGARCQGPWWLEAYERVGLTRGCQVDGNKRNSQANESRNLWHTHWDCTFRLLKTPMTIWFLVLLSSSCSTTEDICEEN